MERERVKGFWSRLWKESLEDMIFGNQAKHKLPVGISWLNAHRLFDFRRWRGIRSGKYAGGDSAKLGQKE